MVHDESIVSVNKAQTTIQAPTTKPHSKPGVCCKALHIAVAHIHWFVLSRAYGPRLKIPIRPKSSHWESFQFGSRLGDLLTRFAVSVSFHQPEAIDGCERGDELFFDWSENGRTGSLLGCGRTNERMWRFFKLMTELLYATTQPRPATVLIQNSVFMDQEPTTSDWLTMDSLAGDV